MSLEQVLDPAIEELLRELAADPRSSLLRVPRTANPGVLFPEQPLARASGTWLTRAERELVRVHRSALASLLRQAYVELVYESARPELGLVRRVTAADSIAPLDRPDWRARLSRTFDAAPRDCADASCAELIARCVSDAGWYGLTVTQLALAAERLEPRDHGRIAMALELAERGHADQAERLDRRIAQTMSRAIDAAYAYVNLSRLLESRGDVRGAFEANARAACLMPELALPHLNVVVYSTLAGQQDSARESFEWVVANVDRRDATVSSIRTAQIARWKPESGRVVPRDVTHRARASIERFGGAVEGLLNVLAE